MAKIASKSDRKGADTTGLYNSGSTELALRNSNTTGGGDVTLQLGERKDLPVAGDWDADGVTDIGVFNPDSGRFLLRFASGAIAVVASSGGRGDLPVAGDWDGDGFDTPGFYRNSGRAGQSFFLTNARVEDGTFPDFDVLVALGQAGDLPLAGDWNGDGLDTVGVYRPSTSTFFQTDDLAGGAVRSFVFGVAGDRPLAGDWNGDFLDDVGVFRASDRTMRLTTDAGFSESIVFEFQSEGDTPIGGNWDGGS